MAPYAPTQWRRFGRLDWSCTLAGFGSVALGNMRTPIPTEDARALVRHAWDAGVRFFDTAPMYGHGLAEYRLADVLADEDRETFVLATKVGRTLKPASPGTFSTAPWCNTPPFRIEYDYSYDGVMRQVEDSMQRMGTDYFDVLLVHDTDRWTHGADQPRRFQEALNGAFKALFSLRDQKVVRAVGIGVNEVDVCMAAAEAADIDCILIAGTYNLLNTEAQDELLPLCLRRGIAVINGRIFGSGILATGPKPGARKDYAPATFETLSEVRPYQEVADRHGVPLGAVALQFGAAHPAVTNVCLGARTIIQQEQNYQWLSQRIPVEVWQELKHQQLISSVSPTPETSQ